MIIKILFGFFSVMLLPHLKENFAKL